VGEHQCVQATFEQAPITLRDHDLLRWNFCASPSISNLNDLKGLTLARLWL